MNLSRTAFSLVLAFSILLTGYSPLQAQEQTVGLFLRADSCFDGYTLFAPTGSLQTYLIDNAGRFIHSWSSTYGPGRSVYLLENGDLMHTASYAPPGSTRFSAGGAGGRVEWITWNDDLIWEFDYSNDLYRQHHDIEILPNGNVLMIAWEYKSESEAIAAGRSPLLLPDGELWPDHIIEVQPAGAAGGSIVWEWHVWDHLIQDNDPTKANYGVVADHPELVDLNYDPNGGIRRGVDDWNHINSIDYHPAFDQLVLSVHHLGEIWVIDHSTTLAEAAGHTGGNSGKGGDLLYRWGNPEAYRAGDATDRQLFNQHDARWIEPGAPGAGNITIFNNGGGRPGGNYTSIDEIVPPVDEFGSYTLIPGSAFDPSGTFWSYTADPPTDFYAQNVSGAHRLPNGNTLICHGPQGTFFEVTSAGEVVWRYVNPVVTHGPLEQGEPIPPATPGNSTFRATRYASDDSRLAGLDLTPGDPVELYTRPLPVPDGEGGTTMLTAALSTPGGDSIDVEWDAAACPASAYILLYGELSDLPSYTLTGSECLLKNDGADVWEGVPAGDLFFLVVGRDDTGVYESSWGTTSAGTERNGDANSGMCGVNYKDTVESCP